MVDFDLTQTDSEIVELAHQQALVYRRYARRFDKDLVNGVNLGPIPEEQDFPHVRDAGRARSDETSGPAIIDALIYLEEIWGNKPIRHKGPHGDTMNYMLSNGVLKKIGTPEQVARWGDTVFCYGLTEPGAGSDAAGVRTTAVYDNATDEWVINGEKTFISLGEASEAVMILARFVGPDGARGLSNFVIEKGTPGFTLGPQIKKMGQRHGDTVPLSFVDCRVPRFNHLAGDLKNMLAVLNGTRVLVGVQALGYARAALDFAREKLAESGVIPDYSANLGRQPAIVVRLMQLEAKYEAVWLAVMRAQWSQQQTGTADKVAAAIAKALGGTMVRKVVRDVMELLGAFSLSEEHLLEEWFRDSRVVDIYEGPGEIQRLLIGRELFGYAAKELN
jgi:acyl-CoA dehydrogenase